MSNNIQLFNFGDNQKIRTVLIESEIWFVAQDVSNILELANMHSSLSLLDEDEKGLHTVDTPGGKQDLTVISESGLYSLVLRSRKPEAHTFKKWVTKEVLPAIRKTGKYEIANQKKLPTNYIEALESLLQSEKEKVALQLENKQKDEHIVNLSNDVQETRLALAKQYKTVDARNKADIGKAINDLVLKHFKKEGMLYPEAHKASWGAYLFATGVHYPGAVKATYEQKLSFLNFLTTL